ncbi:hypothetical protein ACPXCE_03940 [Streptomyces sp. DT24]|uniref:hypothetical protein n=1 Tax=Streptomyces sp. DT24 TaxID=3416520 RepID=UPI003CEAF7A6
MTATAPAPAPTTTGGWAAAWLAAFEAAAAAPRHLRSGKSLLGAGTLGQVNISAGLAHGRISTGKAGATVQPRLGVTEVAPDRWTRIYRAIAERPDVTEAIASGRFVDVLTDPATTAGVPLAPRPGDLSFSCTCGPRGVVCPHTAAIGYSVADRLRKNPGIILSLRGGSMKSLRAALGLRPTAAPVPGTVVPASGSTTPSAVPDAGTPEVRDQGTPGSDPAGPGTGMPAHEAFSRWNDRAGAVPGPPREPLTGAPLLDTLRDAPPAPAPGLDVLRLLTRDAAHRASALLDGGLPGAVPGRGDRPGPPDPADGTDPLLDAARMLARPEFLPWLESAAGRLGLTTVQLRHLALAHEYGGPGNVEAAAHRVPADPRVLARAENAIQPLRPAPLATLVGEDNRLTDAAARVQLRLAAGRWYPFVDWHGTWRPVAGHCEDPATAYRAARRALRGA